VLELPELLETRLGQLASDLRGKGKVIDTELHDRWSAGFVEDLRRNVTTVSMLNRELREKSKFIATLREKDFEFNLVQEYLLGFMEIFRRINPEAYEEAEQ
jgi:hypothetical protein